MQLDSEALKTQKGRDCVMFQPSFRKHVVNCVNVTWILQRTYCFLDFHMNSLADPINNFLLIPAKAMILFSTVFCNVIFFTIAIPNRFLMFTWTQFYGPFRFTEVNCLKVTKVNFIHDIVFIFCSYLTLRLEK